MATPDFSQFNEWSPRKSPLDFDAAKYVKPNVNPATGGYTSSPTGVPNGQTIGLQNAGVQTPNSPGVGPNQGSGGALRGSVPGVQAGETLRPTLKQGLFGSSGAWGDAASGIKQGIADKLTYQPATPQPANLAPGALRRAASGLGTLATRVGGVGGAAYGAYEAAGDIKQGNYGDAALHSADAIASAATLTPAAPAALTYLGVRGVSSLINDNLSDGAKDKIGGAVNSGLRGAGNLIGQDWGVDDSAYKASNALRTPQPAAAVAAQTRPASPQTPAATAATIQPTSATPANTLRGQSGTDMGGGISKFVQNGSTLYSNVQGGDNDTLMNRGPASAQNLRAMDGIQARQDQGDAAYAAKAKFDGEVAAAREINSRAPAQDTGGYGILDKGYQRARSLRMDASDSKSGLETNAQHAARTGAASRAIEGMNKEISDAPRMAAERNNQLRIHQMTNDTQGKIASMHNTTALRGQDIAREGHLLTNDVAKANARYQVSKDKRDFDISRTDYANTRDDKNFEKRQQATKALHEEIGTMLPPGADGKPDTARAAQYATGLNALLGDRQRELQTALKNDPSNPRAKEWQANLEHLTTNGPAALDGATKQKYLAGMLAKDTASANHGVVTPWSGKAVNTNSPVVSLRSKPGIIFDDYSAKHSDGSESVIPARAVDGGWFSPADKRLQSLKY